jgi:hypothetical protein
VVHAYCHKRTLKANVSKSVVLQKVSGSGGSITFLEFQNAEFTSNGV